MKHLSLAKVITNQPLKLSDQTPGWKDGELH